MNKQRAGSSFAGHSQRLARAQAQADRVGEVVSSALTEQASALTHDFVERLRVGRLRAMEHRQREVAARASQFTGGFARVGGSAAALYGNGYSNEGEGAIARFLGPVLPILALVFGFWWMSAQTADERVIEIATVDAAILKDDLPPAAYADPGFAQFMRDNR